MDERRNISPRELKKKSRETFHIDFNSVRFKNNKNNNIVKIVIAELVLDYIKEGNKKVNCQNKMKKKTYS